MTTMTIYICAWVGLVALAIVNGIVRNRTYGRSMSELSAHQLSTISFMVLFGIYLYILTAYFQIHSASEALAIGGVWLLMTIIFEFLFGHYIAGHCWRRLMQDYDVLNGRVWILVLVMTFAGPYVFYRLRY
jgi:hypothetical protein